MVNLPRSHSETISENIMSFFDDVRGYAESNRSTYIKCLIRAVLGVRGDENGNILDTIVEDLSLPAVIDDCEDNANQDSFHPVLQEFNKLSAESQIPLVCQLLNSEEKKQFLEQCACRRDVLTLPPELSVKILTYLDGEALKSADLVSRRWHQLIVDERLWQKQIRRKVNGCPVWKRVASCSEWGPQLFRNAFDAPEAVEDEDGTGGEDAYVDGDYITFTVDQYNNASDKVEMIEKNSQNLHYEQQQITCESNPTRRGVYCIQYDEQRIVSGHRDCTIKVYNRNSLQCEKTLSGHTGSVLCLQFDDKIVVSGSSDMMVRIWNVTDGQHLTTLDDHTDKVLNLKFHDTTLVTCSMSSHIAVYEMKSPTNIQLSRRFKAHENAVNAIDFDQRYIVSASSDRTIKVWDRSSYDVAITFTGHIGGVNCLQFHGHLNLVVSGSTDTTVRIWDVVKGHRRELCGHSGAVRCVWSDGKRIISGCTQGEIKVWDMDAVLEGNPDVAPECTATRKLHSGSICCLKADPSQIISCSLDGTIQIMDFLHLALNVSDG